MASAFANNTQHMNSSDKISNSKAKTNYNYLRLVSKQSTSCYEDYITSSSGNVVLKTKKKIEPDDEQISDQEPKYIPISQLVRASSYELLRSINKGYYLPTSIPKGEINRPPYTYGEKCLDIDNPWTKQNPNTSGDLQDILFNEYLDFGNLRLITNTTFKSHPLASPDANDTKITKIKEGQPNELQIIDASFGDYIIDPDNILNNFKDCNLSTYLGLENKKNEEGDTIVQWKQIDNTLVYFPSNKYKKFGSNKPIFFYDYDKCSSD